jgi:hypothetical protein
LARHLYLRLAHLVRAGERGVALRGACVAAKPLRAALSAAGHERARDGILQCRLRGAWLARPGMAAPFADVEATRELLGAGPIARRSGDVAGDVAECDVTAGARARPEHGTGRTGGRVATVRTGVAAGPLSAAREIARRRLRPAPLHTRERRLAAHARDTVAHDDFAGLAVAQVARHVALMVAAF